MIESEKENKIYPLMPLRDIVVFPHMVAPLVVGRQKSIKALENAMSKKTEIFLVTQWDANEDEPQPESLHSVGTIAVVMQLLRLPDGTIKALVEGKRRGRIIAFQPQPNFMAAVIEEAPETDDDGSEIIAYMREIRAAFEEYIKTNKKIPKEVLKSLGAITDPSRFVDVCVSHLPLQTKEKQVILEVFSVLERLKSTLEFIQREIEIAKLEQTIRTRVKNKMEKTQKDYYLNEQMRVIQQEMGGGEEDGSGLAELEKAIEDKKLPKHVSAKVTQEFKKLKFMQPMSAEATVVRNYIDTILNLPWYEKTKSKIDINQAEAILEEDHYGLIKPKERIIEYLAVQAQVKKIKGPILCLVGPPGVGKTSLCKSIARVDKMSMDFRGDPASALLEVLDPEQNHSFNDHYLDLDYDLSDIFFVTTANNLHSIPPPLQDRMEIIKLDGYTEEDKLKIAQGFLIPKQLEANGFKPDDITFNERSILEITRRYTREAGVRNLERNIASVCRKVAREKLKKNETDKKFRITAKTIHRYLGIPRFRFGLAEEKDEVGLSTGLAWTEVGGELLQIETTLMPGKGKLTITGKLGDVMQESAQAALSYVRSRALRLGLLPDFYQKLDIHVHVPEGAIPKDGPSAGITMATSLVSALLKIPVRRDIAMTGEITLRGRVLPIGGLTEKLLAARRGNIKHVLIPRENERNLKEVPIRVRKLLKIELVEHMDEVLQKALVLKAGTALFTEVPIESVSADITASVHNIPH